MNNIEFLRSVGYRLGCLYAHLVYPSCMQDVARNEIGDLFYDSRDPYVLSLTLDYVKRLLLGMWILERLDWNREG